MKQVDFKRIDELLKVKRKTSFRLAVIGSLLSVSFCVIGTVIAISHIPGCAPLIAIGMLIFGLSKAMGSFSEASKAASLLRCSHCGSPNTSLMGVDAKFFDTTEIETRRTTYFNNDAEQIGYSETDYEVPGVGATYTSRRHCADCGKDFARESYRDIRNLPTGSSEMPSVFLTLLPYSILPIIVVLSFYAKPIADWVKHGGRSSPLGRNKIARAPKLDEKSAINLHGVGPVQIGMSTGDAFSMAGYPLVNYPESSQKDNCYIAPLKQGSNEIDFLIHDNHIACIYINGGSFATLRGVKIGQSIERLVSLYGDHL